MSELKKFCEEYWNGQLADGWLNCKFDEWAGLEDAYKKGDHRTITVSGDYYDQSLEIKLHGYDSLDDFKLSDEGIKEIIEAKIHFWVNLYRDDKRVQDQHWGVKDGKLIKSAPRDRND